MGHDAHHYCVHRIDERSVRPFHLFLGLDAVWTRYHHRGGASQSAPVSLWALAGFCPSTLFRPTLRDVRDASQSPTGCVESPCERALRLCLWLRCCPVCRPFGSACWPELRWLRRRQAGSTALMATQISITCFAMDNDF